MPVTPHAIAADAVPAVAAGADALHIHPKDAAGRDTLEPDVVAVREGFQARIGLGDTLALPDGSPARGNADLVTAARALIAGSG